MNVERNLTLKKMNKINKEVVQKLIEEGYISVQKHPDTELYIYNYTPRTQFEKKWDDTTMMCRGLITDQDGNILYRPFKKFFNLEEHLGQNKPLPNCGFAIYPKFDGSLGILYKVNGKCAVATRGSFTSDQALHATELLYKKYPNIDTIDGTTLLFEIIYPENRIVVDYKGIDDLVFLAAINTEFGSEMPMPQQLIEWGMPRALRLTDLEKEPLLGLTEKDRENEEGYVILFDNGLRLKVKFAEYKRLHRLVTGVNAKTIWELLKSGQSVKEILERVPDEFYEWVKKTKEELESNYKEIEAEAREDMQHMPLSVNPPTRRDFAEYFKSCRHPSIMFKMLDKQDYSDIIWKMIRPVATKPFKNDTDI